MTAGPGNKRMRSAPGSVRDLVVRGMTVGRRRELFPEGVTVDASDR
jgi:hypothetical protein